MAWVVATYRLIALAIVPLALTLAADLFSATHEATTRELSTHEKLLKAYVEVAETYSDYRYAADSLTLLASGRVEVPIGDMKTAALDLINAFDALGAKLTPFEDVEKRYTPGHVSILSEIWGSCFTHPFFDLKQGYRTQIETQLSFCGKVCPVGSVQAIKNILPNIDRPLCPSSDVHLKDERQKKDFQNQKVDMGTIWNELDGIISDQDPLDHPSTGWSIMHFFWIGGDRQSVRPLGSPVATDGG